MEQSVKVIARTFEVNNENPEKMNDDLTLLSGKAAGVCYMPDDYFENGIQNKDKAMTRADNTSKSGHHSVYDHGHVTMVIKTSKMMCMLLNSLGVYATSEKSARYTKMQPETELEQQLYDKWNKKIKELILNKYPDTDDKMLQARFNKYFAKVIDNKTCPPCIKNGEFKVCSGEHADEFRDKLEELKGNATLPSSKLAQENARYMISVFTPTTIEYTVSFRQLFLIIDYLHKLVLNCEYIKDNADKLVDKNNVESTLDFICKLTNQAFELKTKLESVCGTVRIFDNKNQYMRFMEGQNLTALVGPEHHKKQVELHNIEGIRKGKEQTIGDSYTLVYNGSLAMLAQAQRHRTLRYTMLLEYPGQFGYYTPEIVKDAGLENEWQHDMESVSYCTPQGTMVRITEQGIFEDFALKCKERMCGRAQLEVMKRTAKSVELFIEDKDKLCDENQRFLDSMIDVEKQKPEARCKFDDFYCTEGCPWGKMGVERLI